MYDMQTMLQECTVCPHKCGVNRLLGGLGVCRAGINPKVALVSLHHWEEPCISGERGSGTIFFSHCNLQCIFCQNFAISQQDFGKEVTVEELAWIFLLQEERKAHNLNLVSGTQFLLQIRDALILAKQKGLSIPVVYNTNGYESVEMLREMEGLIDVYLPDLKYVKDEYAQKYSAAPHYFDYVTIALLEMYRQVGVPRFDEEGMVQKGLIIRHMLLPGHLEDSKRVLDWIKANLSHEVFVSLMAQYTPMYKTEMIPELQRRITQKEYDSLIDYFLNLGLENGFVQELESATSRYTPAFDLSGFA